MMITKENDLDLFLVDLQLSISIFMDNLTKAYKYAYVNNKKRLEILDEDCCEVTYYTFKEYAYIYRIHDTLFYDIWSTVNNFEDLMEIFLKYKDNKAIGNYFILMMDNFLTNNRDTI